MKTIQCRVAIVDLQCASEKIQAMEPFHLFLLWENADYGIEGVAVYKYCAPEGFERSVGYGILFQNDWSAPDTMTRFQYQGDSGVWRDL